MQNARAVEGSIEFRDLVMAMTKENLPVYVRLNGSEAPTYRILTGLRGVTVDDLFNAPYPPIQMEEFASALWRAEKVGDDVPAVNVFTLR